MPRVKNGVITKKRRKKILKKAKGFRGSRNNLFKSAKETVYRAGMFAFRDRKAKKRNFRQLWITRINAALETHQLSYSKFVNLLKKSQIELNRKTMANLAIEDPQAFAKIVETAQKSA
jgi:large subunit ribosomal protein L20